MPSEGHDSRGKFAPGNKLAPGGRPGKRLWIKLELDKILDEVTTYGEGDKAEVMTRREKILRAAVALAEEGDRFARDFIADRTDGKVRDVPVEEAEERAPIKLIDFAVSGQAPGTDG